jgi:hypothetical protein
MNRLLLRFLFWFCIALVSFVLGGVLYSIFSGYPESVYERSRISSEQICNSVLAGMDPIEAAQELQKNLEPLAEWAESNQIEARWLDGGCVVNLDPSSKRVSGSQFQPLKGTRWRLEAH